MPPLTAPELELWERRFSRSLEDLEPLHSSDGQYARRETKVRQARVRKQRLARECTTPKHSVARARAARTAHATDKGQNEVAGGPGEQLRVCASGEGLL